MGKPSPTLPEPQPVTVDVRKAAVLVLDGSQRWSNPEQPCHRLVPAMTKFLRRVREAGMPIIYTISARSKGTPEGEVCSALGRRRRSRSFIRTGLTSSPTENCRVF